MESYAAPWDCWKIYESLQWPTLPHDALGCPTLPCAALRSPALPYACPFLVARQLKTPPRDFGRT